ncbi:hypothetical protein N3K66_008846 [Trichothecium roseum]|uniref:Uncharacterized protein n=1 Tax=Trichothecium roseum TaxID=47278 RepID=A0ACC0UR95_9HYPO|nr:hypothetical protein N3K66_008846 [Trichothecium roseum]
MATPVGQQEAGKSSSTSTSTSTTGAMSKPEAAASRTHDLQLRYKLSSATLRNIDTVARGPDRRAVLEKACSATVELRSFPMRDSERAFFRHINDHTNIPYPLLREGASTTGAVAAVPSEPWHKVFLLVQADLSGTAWPNKISGEGRRRMLQERGRMYGVLGRSLRCLVDVMGRGRDGRGVAVGLDVLRSVAAGVWEGAGRDLLQVGGVGEKKMARLAGAGVAGVGQLGRMECYHVERLLSRNPPFGQNLLRSVAGFPALRMSVDIVTGLEEEGDGAAAIAAADDVAAAGKVKVGNGQQRQEGKGTGGEKPKPQPQPPCWVARVKLGFENPQPPVWKKKRPWTTLVVEGEDGRLLWFWRGSVKRLEGGGKELLVCLRASRGELVRVVFACEEIVGTSVRESFRL